MVTESLKDDILSSSDRYPVHYKTKMCYFCYDR